MSILEKIKNIIKHPGASVTQHKAKFTPLKIDGKPLSKKDMDLLIEAIYGEANPDEKEIRDIASIAINRATEKSSEFGKTGEHGPTPLQSVLNKPFAFEGLTGDQKDSGIRQRVQKLRDFKADPVNNPLPKADIKQLHRIRAITRNLASGQTGTTTSDLFFKHKESDKSLFTTRDFNKLKEEL